MNPWMFVFVALFAWTARELAVAAWTWSRRRRWRHTLRAERTCSQFAEARNQLMDLAIAGKIDPSSLTFRMLYMVNTHAMRRPDQYPELSAHLRRALMAMDPKDRGSSALRQESKAWSEDVKGVVRATAKAMNSIVLDYSFALRVVAKLEQWFGAVSAAEHLLERIGDVVEKAERKHRPLVEEVRHTQESMLGLCSAA